MKAALFLIVALSVPASAAERPTKAVRIDFLEALAPRDTTSSEEFRRQFDSSVALGIKLTQDSLKTCGYHFDQHTTFYSASDTLQARERSEEADKAGTWLVVGPRRSDHYLLVANGAPQTPSVSLMAGSSEVEALGPLHLTVYAPNSALAPALADFAKRSLKPKQAPTYLTVVSDDCLFCKDFSALFDSAAAGNKLKKLGEVKVVTDSPDTAPVVEAVLKYQPAFVVLPNYSKVSSQVMSSIQSKFPSVLFLGGDGWGDGKFGFVDRNPSLSTASGLTVRGFPPVEVGLEKFALGRKVLQGKASGEFVPQSGPGMAILRIIEGTKDLLCKARPKDRDAFRMAFKTRGRNHFSAPWGVSVYRLENARVSYWQEASKSRSARQ